MNHNDSALPTARVFKGDGTIIYLVLVMGKWMIWKLDVSKNWRVA